MPSKTITKTELRAAVARFSPRQSHWTQRCDHAAVALVIRDADGQLELLLVKRAQRKGDRWSGHWAFPGGLADSTDATLLDTAVRETREEVGIDLLESGCVLGRLSDVVTLSHRGSSLLAITPFVAELSSDVRPKAGAEVESHRWLPLVDVCVERAGRSRLGRMAGWLWPRSGMAVGESPLWGLSLRMLDELVYVLRGR